MIFPLFLLQIDLYKVGFAECSLHNVMNIKLQLNQPAVLGKPVQPKYPKFFSSAVQCSALYVVCSE